MIAAVFQIARACTEPAALAGSTAVHTFCEFGRSGDDASHEGVMIGAPRGSVMHRLRAGFVAGRLCSHREDAPLLVDARRATRRFHVGTPCWLGMRHADAGNPHLQCDSARFGGAGAARRNFLCQAPAR